MNAEAISRAVHRLDFVLSKHGYLSSRASEHALSKPCSDAQLSGDHARFMCEEIKRFLRMGDVQRALRWLRFTQGIVWTLGVFSLEEIRAAEEIN